MMLLDNHLEQIATSARAIADLEFPPTKIFTNALLGRHEITTLIRDTEPHEKSLFTLNPDVSKPVGNVPSRRSLALGADGSNRRKTVNVVQQRHGSAVARVLGSDMLQQIQQPSRGHGKARGVDVEILLQGAERLCGVYPVAGARERISKLRNRYAQLSESVVHYERLVLKQQARLTNLNKAEDDGDDLGDDGMRLQIEASQILTEEDLHVEEDEIRELEIRKKALEDRVAGMEKDLGGLLH